VILGHISSFTEYEGVRYLIEAIAILLEESHGVGGLLVGDGSELDALKAQAEQLGIADNIVFTGRVPYSDILRYYSLIDIFVVPRTADRVSQLVTPLKPFEAMATGRAVVLSRVDALHGMILEGKTGLTFRSEDPRDLAAVVLPLVNNPVQRQSLGLAARDWVVANRSWRQNGQRCLELYRSMGIALSDSAARPWCTGATISAWLAMPTPKIVSERRRYALLSWRSLSAEGSVKTTRSVAKFRFGFGVPDNRNRMQALALPPAQLPRSRGITGCCL
jgi:hypothetical protein